MWVLTEAKKELRRFYPGEEDGSIPIGWIWARTVPCQNIECKADIPLMRQFWLAKKGRKKVALLPYHQEVDAKHIVQFKIVGDGYEPMPASFNPSNATVSRAVVVCPCCGTAIEAKTTRKLFKDGKSGERMVAVVTPKPGARGKQYRVPTEADLEVFQASKAHLTEKQDQLTLAWGMNSVPDEELPLMSGVFNVPIYGMHTWGDLFNARQKLGLITFVEKVKAAPIKKWCQKELIVNMQKWS